MSAADVSAERDPRVSLAIAHWGPRFIQNGVNYNDFVATTGRIDHWDEWLPEWSRTADAYEDRAVQAERDGHWFTAGTWWRNASICRHFGKFVWTVDLALAAEATVKSARARERALAILDPSAVHLQVPYRGVDIFATLRRPTARPGAPLVVLVPGLDSTREEFYLLEDAFLERGMATLSVDGPGQGVTGLRLPIQADYHDAVAAVLDHVCENLEPVVRAESIGLCGVSLGGFYAPLIAAHEKRVKAMVALSGPYSVRGLWSHVPEVSKGTFLARAHASSEEDAAPLIDDMDLEGLCSEITARSLYVTGDRDGLVRWQDTERQARETPDGSFVLVEGGNHCVSNFPHVRPMVVDWLSDQLR